MCVHVFNTRAARVYTCLTPPAACVHVFNAHAPCVYVSLTQCVRVHTLLPLLLNIGGILMLVHPAQPLTASWDVTWMSHGPFKCSPLITFQVALGSGLVLLDLTTALSPVPPLPVPSAVPLPCSAVRRRPGPHGRRGHGSGVSAHARTGFLRLWS